MKKNKTKVDDPLGVMMRYGIIAPAAILLLCASVATAVFDGKTPVQIPEVFEWQRTGKNATVVFESPELSWLNQKDGTDIPLLAGSGGEFVPGAPPIPLYSRMVVAPAGMDARIVDIKVTWEDAGVHTIAHDPGDMPELQQELEKWEPASLDMKKYIEVAQRSGETAVLGETGRWRDIRVAQLIVRPLRYDAATGQTDLARRVEIELEYTPSAEIDGYDPPRVSEALMPLYRAYVLGALDELDETEVTRGTYLIIVPAGYVEMANLLAEWRTKCGFNVIVATTAQTGTSTGSIHNYIDNIYENTDPPLDYVLLFGDMDTPSNIATYQISGSPPHNPTTATDHKYTYDPARTAYADVLPRYFVGRLSADTQTEARIVVNKILQYEVTPDDGDLDRFEEGFVVGCYHPTTYLGISPRQALRWVRQQMLDNGFETVTAVIPTYPNTDPTGVYNAVNGGVSWVGYRGYGSYISWVGPDFYNNNVEQLTNINKLPVITSMVCGGGAFDRPQADPCFGEKWIRTGTVNSLRGAVAFAGPAELNTHTRWNNIMLAGWYRGMFDFDLRTMGQCLLAAKIETSNAYPGMWNPNPTGLNVGRFSAWYYFHTYNILGDPALQLRREVPEDIIAEHLEDVPENATYLLVEVTVDDEDETPLENARVVITDGDIEITAMDLTDEDGIAYVYFTEPFVGEGFEITVTRPDMIPYTGELNSVDQAGLEMTEVSILEDEEDEENNADNFINPGELIVPAAVFEVIEAEGIDNLEVTVSLPSGGGEVTVESEEFGNVETGAEVTLSEPRIRIDEDRQNGEPVEILFTFQGDGDFEQSHLVILEDVTAPVLSFSAADYGDNIEPGDTLTLAITVANTHPTLGAGEVGGVLVTTDTDVTITDSQGTWDDVSADDEAETTDGFEIVIDDSTYPGSELDFTLRLTTEEGYETSIPFTLVVDGADDVNSPTGPAGPGYWFFEDNDEGYGFDVNFEYTSLNLVGDDLGINDNGDNQDGVETAELPFDFPYWDDNYEEITISSNGWFSFEETEFYLFRNREIPAALMPEAAVAVFWDNLAGGTVYTYHDEDEGWFGIEWYNFQYINLYNAMMGSNMRFQVRLLDPEVHGAPGGLGIMVLMYDDIDNGNSECNYCTIGITSPDGESGLQYEFNDDPAPTATGVHDGLQIVIAVGSGDGIQLPDLSYYPPMILFRAGQDEEITSSFTLTNTGGLRMTYSLWLEGIWSSWPLGDGEDGELNAANGSGDTGNQGIGNPVEIPGTTRGLDNIPERGTGFSELDLFRGPDEFGYLFYDSDEMMGPVYDWIEIAEDTNEVEWEERTDPKVSLEIELPFAFHFYGESYESVWITETGYMVFIDPHGMAQTMNRPLPRDYAPFAGLFAFWDDIGIDEGGGVYAQAFTDSFVVTWDGLHHLTWDEEDGPYTFQALLTSDGAIHLRYDDMNPSFRSCTVGIQNHIGTIGLEVTRNMDAVPYIHNELSVRIVPPPTWFSIDSVGGRIAPDETITINLTGSTEGMEEGIYEARIVIMDETNVDLDVIPVTLSVYEGEPGGVPVVGALPGESILLGEQFRPLSLDPYVYDPDNTDDEISWVVYGDPGITVEIDSNRVAHPSASEDWTGETTLIFQAADPDLNWVEVEVEYDIFGGNDVPRFDDASTDFYPGVDSLERDSVITLMIEVSDPEDDTLSLTWYYGEEEIATDTNMVEVAFDSLGVDSAWVDSVWVVISDGELEAIHKWWLNIYEIIDINEVEETIPTCFAFEHVYPNPFNSRIVVSYALPRTADVQLKVFNILGREVSRLHLYHVAAGRHRLILDGQSWSSGIYFLQWQAGGVSEVRKVVLLK